jgi:hypothetical protein
MRFFRRKRPGPDTARLHEHDAVRDVVAGLLAARPSTAGVAYLFTSLRHGQGTSTLAAAVARGLADSGRRTLLAVVSDPSAEAPLDGAVPLRDFVRTPHRAASLLTVEVPARLTDFPESAHDPRGWLDGAEVLILDAPALTDSLTRYWVPKVDGVVLVADGEQIAVKAVIQAREDLERLGGRLVGVVLNRYRSRLPRWIAPYYIYG